MFYNCLEFNRYDKSFQKILSFSSSGKYAGIEDLTVLRRAMADAFLKRVQHFLNYAIGQLVPIFSSSLE